MYMLECPIMEQGPAIFNYFPIHVCEIMQRKKEDPLIDARIHSLLIYSDTWVLNLLILLWTLILNLMVSKVLCLLISVDTTD